MSDSRQAVFLSYASQDAEAARRICEALRAAGVEVWFDQSELRGGDAWDAKIRKQIKECALFVPIISTNTNARPEGYFRLEWKLAVDRSHLVADDHAFLFPIALGDVNDATARVPEKFREVQWTRLRPAGSGGQALDGPGVEAFCTQLKGLLEGRDAPPSRPGLPEEDTSRRRQGEAPLPPSGSKWIWGGVALVALVLGLALWRPWQSGGNKPLASPAPPTSGAPALAVSDKSVLVLPLENLSPDPANAFFTDGIQAEIIATLQRIPDLKVISRDSTLAFKGSTASLAEKAQKVGVANTISGSVRRAGTSVRVQLDLHRARDEALLWTQTYDKELGAGLIAIQTDIAEQVARVLQARERRGTNAGAQFMTANPEAYDLFLKASQTFSTDRQKTIAALEQALRLDPGFSSAARSLASALIQCYTSERNPAVKLQYAREAKRWAETARQLLPGGAGDHALASYYSKIEPDNARALALAENAIKALPNDAAVFNAFAIALSEAGREAEAVERYRQAISLDPDNIVFRYNLVGNLARLRRRADSERAVAEYIAAQGPRTKPSPLKTSHDYRLDGTLPDSLDGFDAPTRLLWLQRSRREAEALSLIESMLAGPDLDDEARWSGWIAKCDALRRAQREPEATQAAREANVWLDKLNTLPTLDASERDGRLAVTLARLGRVDEAIAAGRRYVGAINPQNQVRRRRARELEIAELYSYLGRPRECVELLAKLLPVVSDISVPMLRMDPKWDNVREDAGFKALLADPKNSAPL